MGLWLSWTNEKKERCGVEIFKSRLGFSKTELLIGMGVVSVATSLAVPHAMDFKESLGYRQAAREIASVLRQARSLAIAENWEHRVEFDIADNKYRMTRGNMSNNSSSWPTVVKDWMDVPPGVVLMRNLNCDNGTYTTIHFNPNGSANKQYICIMDDGGRKKYQVGVSYQTTGRVKVE